MYSRKGSKGLAKIWAILLVVIIVAGISAGVLLTQFWPSAPGGPKYTIVVDMTGRAVNVPASVSKVVVLQSYWAEVACLLGGGDKIVGISRSAQDSIWIPDFVKNRTVVGDIFTGVNLETVVALKPDVVITDTGYGKAEEIIKALEDQGIPVVRMFCQSFDDQLKAIRIIGKVLGSESKAEELINYLSSKFNEKIKSIASKIPEKEKPKVLMLSSIEEGLVSTYSNSTWGRAVEDVGGINLAYRNIPGQAWPKVNVETVLSWDPEIIIVVAWDEKTLSRTIQILTKDPWNKTTAAKSGRIYGVLAGGKCREAFLDWGPRMLIGYMQLAKLIQPKYFKDLDWRKEADELLAKFYGLKEYITVKDMRGKEVTVPYPVKRAVALYGGYLLASLGVFDGRIVGVVESYKREPIQLKVAPSIAGLPAVASSFSGGLNTEILLSLRPEVVIAYVGATKLIDQIESLGIPVIAINPANLTLLKEQTLLLGKIFKEDERAHTALKCVDDILHFVEERVKSVPRDKRLTAVEIGIKDSKIYVWGWKTARGQANEYAGLIDLSKENLPDGGYISLETLIKWNPHVIFLDPWSTRSARDILNDPLWQQISAVKNGKVYDQPDLSCYAPQYALVVLYRASKAYPELFKDVNFDEVHKDFFAKVYGVPVEPQYARRG